MNAKGQQWQYYLVMVDSVTNLLVATMNMKKSLSFFLFMLISSYAFSQTKDNATTTQQPMEVVKATKGLQEYIQLNMDYPPDARAKGIEGKVILQFKIDSAGYLVTDSIRIIHSLYSSCDHEAARVLKSFGKVFIQNPKKAYINWSFVVPIEFKLTQFYTPIQLPRHRLKKPIQTLVIKKISDKSTSRWSVYSDMLMKSKSGSILVGDSVKVTGWAAWTYSIESRNINGYISWKSLLITPELDSIHQLIAEQSEFEDKKQNQNADSLLLTIPPKASLTTHASKKTIYVGECVTFNVSFNVEENNTVPLQFYDLATQLSSLIDSTLKTEHCWISDNVITDVIGEEKKNGQTNYTSYTIYKASYCPITSKSITIPAFNLNLARSRADSPEEIIGTEVFTSKPLTVKVIQPTGISIDNNGSYQPTGVFKLKDGLYSAQAYAGQPVKYYVTVHGDGLTFPLQVPKIVAENLISELIDIKYSDSIINDVYYSSKTFVYNLTFSKEGIYDIGEKIMLTFFNTKSRKFESLIADKQVIVKKINGINNLLKLLFIRQILLL